jgi:hypothetical protein
VLLQPRQNQPPGTAFTQSQFRAEVVRAENQWTEIEVYNSGTTAQTVVLQAHSPSDLPAGFMGSGSVDAPLTLPPGEWKKVRLVAMAGTAGMKSYVIPLSLHLIADGKYPDSTVDLTGNRAHDSASLVLNIASQEFRLEAEPLPSASAPVLLAQKYRITNRGGDLPDFAINFPPESQGKVICQPSFGFFPLASGGSVEATFAPRLSAGFTRLETRAILSSGRSTQLLPLTFEVPRGKKVFLAKGHSTQATVSENRYCTNSGGKDTALDGPPKPGENPIPAPISTGCGCTSRSRSFSGISIRAWWTAA